jgi:hypothetical protein
MKPNRRQFIQIITSAAAGAYALDPERLLWVPGEKKIFIPPARALVWATTVPNQKELEHTLEIIKNLPASDKFLYETIVTENLVQVYYGYTNETRNIKEVNRTRK